MKEKDAVTAKERILALVEQQPDDSSFDEILHELAFARMVDRGLVDVAAGRVVARMATCCAT